MLFVDARGIIAGDSHGAARAGVPLRHPGEDRLLRARQLRRKEVAPGTRHRADIASDTRLQAAAAGGRGDLGASHRHTTSATTLRGQRLIPAADYRAGCRASGQRWPDCRTAATEVLARRFNTRCRTCGWGGNDRCPKRAYTGGKTIPGTACRWIPRLHFNGGVEHGDAVRLNLDGRPRRRDGAQRWDEIHGVPQARRARRTAGRRTGRDRA